MDRQQRRPNPTMRDVARKAGISTATVSHFLNGTRQVSAATSQRILAVMRELNYRPNLLARSLRSRESRTVGLVISDISNPFFPEVARGCEDALAGYDYSLILCNTDEDPVKEDHYLSVLWSKQVDGILLVPTAGQHATLGRMLAAGLPVVYLDREVTAAPATAVMSQNREGAYEATRLLLERGHRQVAMITGKQGLSSTAERVAGYRDALADAGIEPVETWLRCGDSDERAAREATLALLVELPEVTAIFAANNTMTAGVLRALEQAGRRDTVEVAGFDDVGWFGLQLNPVVAVVQAAYDLGRIAAEELVALLKGGDRTPRTIRVPVEVSANEARAESRVMGGGA
ncbi:substrate-binding domain-containing protein [Limnochorda pilosa]|uniref:LacI family transcriptional regulator n=1 Tax=Limnochorda pilosa TaxID=1555112 RepID=A0A0K2SM05_LIMPI|nr:substrate-binding domain-containing protein [Limnochorda pilosa]BAS28047.1 LacI family transcriptional regulator [Limnochorda pilosa]